MAAGDVLMLPAIPADGTRDEFHDQNAKSFLP